LFVDFAKIYLEAGDGGDGCISFRREKYVPRGGPDGGDGGRGGDIYLIADPQMTTLLDVKYKPHFRTKRGEHGGGSQRTGADAEDLTVNVPLGTTIADENGEIIADLTQPGQKFLAASGGRGGRGNQHFATAQNKAPRRFEYGGDGEKKTLILELKVLADAGLVGLPNAGKSTLLSVLTAATPKIAPYPFTTVHPNLGVMEFEDTERCTIADIPGLIEGAHRGTGLGDRFLRHIERTKAIIHLVAPMEDEPASDPERLWYAYELVNEELKSYSPILLLKPQVACLTKTDLLEPAQIRAIVERFAKQGVPLIPISATQKHGMEELRQRIREVLEEMKSSEPVQSDEDF
jgi:GTP-binding protein